VARHEVAECTLVCSRAVAFDPADAVAGTSRFVIVDDYEISGGGIIRNALADQQRVARERVMLREYKWEPSSLLRSDGRPGSRSARPC
jgi:bifunctional enzyme CysN/CysC